VDVMLPYAQLGANVLAIVALLVSIRTAQRVKRYMRRIDRAQELIDRAKERGRNGGL
jgi:hypothetical protein